MKVRPKGSFGRGKTLIDADRSIMFGVQGQREALAPAAWQKLLPAFIRVQFCCFHGRALLHHEKFRLDVQIFLKQP
ncbi:MAG: hypothetical protein LAP85_06175 [Acidobacteriia bacterium]|nr:hypothetical protein [Terriglobia bacterium]